MIFCKRLPLLMLFIGILPLALMGCQDMEKTVYSHQQRVDSDEGSASAPDMFEKDPIINLLGRSFDEITQVLGEPDEQGYSGWLGPHNYLLFRYEEGVVRFCSPEPLEKEIAVSIILGPGQEVLGANVGMTFSEIQDILGDPAFGPDLGMDNLYYMKYFFGEKKQQIPEVFISFSADCIDCPTNDVFIKWEAYEYNNYAF